jgi:two-component system, NarL family, nitrate/nitrite response regulator NarL
MGIQHFVSETGELLPRWREAFPAASAARLGQSAATEGRVQLAWVRLPAGAVPARTLEQARLTLADVPVIVLSDEPNDEEALACFAAGGKGYCNSHAQSELLQRVAQVVSQGGLWIGESLMQRLLQGTARIPLPPSPGPASDWAELLTERERQVATAVAGGESNKEIARRLGITERTVKAHTGAIFGKLNVRDRLQLSLLVHRRPSE